ncbi:DUF5723 family protein [Mucilaginibacter sp.]|uniref:DUF5723 family protein n=1 Tax=Mucilaginibacter sp. TaxID=1882438 RepID=UPI0035BC0866
MRLFLLAICLILSASKVYSQQFSQYNTGTLYESFENPAVRSFIPDSSRTQSFNLLVPNFSGTFYIKGNSQGALKSRAFNGNYQDSRLLVGANAINRVRENANIYFFMYKSFVDLQSNVELGVSWQSRQDSHGRYSDESLALFNGASNFPNDSYVNIFNNYLEYQSYHQISFTYREQFTKRFALGVKLSGLLGIQYQKLDVKQSAIDFDRLNDQAYLTMAGRYMINYTPGQFTLHDNLPTYRNPGASITIGTTYKTRGNFNLQGNLKDLGFISWSSRSATYDFDATNIIPELSSVRREDNIYGAAYDVLHNGGRRGSFVTPTNARVELSANREYWLGYDKKFKYSPTIIASKELFYDGLTIAMVNPVSYRNLTVSVTSSLDRYRVFSGGGQIMIKSPNAEFYIGSEKLIQSGSLLAAALGSQSQIAKNSAYTGADFFLGFSIKFGSVIEHPMNASHIPMDEKKTFIERVWGRLFKHGDY